MNIVQTKLMASARGLTEGKKKEREGGERKRERQNTGEVGKKPPSKDLKMLEKSPRFYVSSSHEETSSLYNLF